MNNDTNSAVGPVTLYLPMGVKIVLPPHITCLSTYIILEQEDWFEEDVAFLRKCLRPGMAVIDVGANYGVYTLSIAKTIGETGHIWAIEPGSFAHDHLKKSIGANGFEQIILLKAALSSHQGTGFLAFGDSEELHRLAPVNPDAPQQGENVFLITLDALMEQENFPAIDFLKLDADGHEPEIIKGAGEFFRQQKPLIMLEVMDDGVVLDVINVFLDWGYSLFRLVPDLNVLVPATKDDLVIMKLMNAYVIHPDAIPNWQEQGAIITQFTLPQSATLQDDIRDRILSYWHGQSWAAPPPHAAAWQSWLCQTENTIQDQHYSRAIALIFWAEQDDGAIDLRYGCLVEAQSLLRDLLAGNADLVMHLALVRVSMALGDRTSAFDHTMKAYDFWQNGGILTAEKPVLPPIDGIGGTDINYAMNIAVLQMLDRLLNRSTIYHADYARQFGDIVCQYPGHSADAERRHLLSTAFCARSIPDSWNASARLTTFGPASPNAHIWSNQTRLFF